MILCIRNGLHTRNESTERKRGIKKWITGDGSQKKDCNFRGRASYFDKKVTKYYRIYFLVKTKFFSSRRQWLLPFLVKNITCMSNMAQCVKAFVLIATLHIIESNNWTSLRDWIWVTVGTVSLSSLKHKTEAAAVYQTKTLPHALLHSCSACFNDCFILPGTSLKKCEKVPNVGQPQQRP